MSNLYIPIGYPIGRVPATDDQGHPILSGVISRRRNTEDTLNESQLAIWEQAFVSHTAEEMQSVLADLLKETPDEVPSIEMVEGWMKEMADDGLLLQISDDPTRSFERLRGMSWHRAGAGWGLDPEAGDSYLVADALTGEAISLSPLEFTIWRHAPHYSSFGELVREMAEFGQDAVVSAIHQLVIYGVGSVGYLITPATRSGMHTEESEAQIA